MEKLREVGFSQVRGPAEDRTVPRLANPMRNFGHADPLRALPGGDARTGDLLKLEPGEWGEILQLKDLKDSQNVLEGSGTSGTAMCKFIKDESEPSLIMETPSFELESLEAFQPQGKEPLGLLEDSAALLAGQQMDVNLDADSSTSFLVDLHQPGPPFPQLRGDPRPRAGLGLDATPPQHLLVCKSEGAAWQPSPAEFWCQPAGLTEDQPGPGGYAVQDGLHGSGYGQRPASYVPFPG